jgi:hypothetical protein
LVQQKAQRKAQRKALQWVLQKECLWARHLVQLTEQLTELL